ncbi:hypothetical protein [Anaerophaga thermohalophila]|uniref:hypothetical protein n=1 Tax=Anaerophaga thermohalophila TaxID=177400 RepID=UPI0009DAD851
MECSLKSLLTPKSPKGDFFKLLIFNSSPLGVRGKNGKNQQFEGFLYWTLLFKWIKDIREAKMMILFKLAGNIRH